MRKIFSLGFCVLSVLSMTAKERTDKDMLSIAKSALCKQSNTRAGNIMPLEVFATKELKVFSYEGKRFVIVSRDDMFEEVLGISDEGSNFDANNIPDGLQFWMNTVSATMSRCKDTGDYSPVYASPKSKVSPTNVPSFVKTMWGQGNPFNLKTPDSNGRSTATGCVATSMSQIFKYFQYPEKLNGKGGYSYSITLKDNETEEKVSKLWTNTTYKWSDMLDTYTGDENETDNSAVAVAELMRDCGYAVHMDYHYEGSGAYSSNVPYAAAMNFRYDSLSVNYYDRTLYTDTEWYDAMYSELAAKYPVYYSGADEEQGGHAFLFDGMKADGMVHVNWGWNGAYDGFFDVSLLRPDPSGDQGEFTVGHGMVLGFRPQQADPSGLRQQYSHSLLLIDSPEVFTESDSLCIKCGIYNIHWRAFTGQLSLCLTGIDKPEQEYILDFMEEGDVLYPNYGYTFKGKNYINFQKYVKSIADGKYYFYIASKATDEDAPQLSRAYGHGKVMWEVEFTKGRVINLSLVDPDEAVLVGIDKVIIDDKASDDLFDQKTINLFGQPVGDDYRGIVIEHGRKVLRR